MAVGRRKAQAACVDDQCAEPVERVLQLVRMQRQRQEMAAALRVGLADGQDRHGRRRVIGCGGGLPAHHPEVGLPGLPGPVLVGAVVQQADQ